MGRLVWGRYWYLYLLLALILPSSQVLLWLYPIMWSGGPLVNFFSFLFGLIVRFAFPLSIVLCWGYIPFLRRNASQVVSDLLQSPINPQKIYQYIIRHSLCTLFAGFFLSSISRWLLSFSVYSRSNFEHPLLSIFFPRASAVSVENHGVGLFNNETTLFLLRFMQDVLSQLRFIASFCFYPLVGILLLIAFWKMKGLFSCLWKLLVLYLVIHIFIYGLLKIEIFFLFRPGSLQNTLNLPLYEILSLSILFFELFLYLVLFGYIYKHIQQYIPFSEEPQVR